MVKIMKGAWRRGPLFVRRCPCGGRPTWFVFHHVVYYEPVLPPPRSYLFNFILPPERCLPTADFCFARFFKGIRAIFSSQKEIARFLSLCIPPLRTEAKLRPLHFNVPAICLRLSWCGPKLSARPARRPHNRRSSFLHVHTFMVGCMNFKPPFLGGCYAPSGNIATDRYYCIGER